MTEDMINWKKAFTALYNASKRGIFITESDGHWWIECSTVAGNCEDFNYGLLLQENGVCVNNKIYDGPLQALKVIHESLVMCGREGLFEEVEYFGSFESEDYLSRITRTTKGNGGLF